MVKVGRHFQEPGDTPPLSQKPSVSSNALHLQMQNMKHVKVSCGPSYNGAATEWEVCLYVCVNISCLCDLHCHHIAQH